MTPIASAIVTAYNEDRFIEQALRSLLGQSLRDIEVVVVDDGSTDRTPEVFESFRDPRLRVYRRPRTGRAAALAFATVQAQGKYIANLDADDEAYPQRLEQQVDFLEQNPDVGWLGCGEERIDTQRGEHLARLYPEDDRGIRRMAARCIPYCHSAVVFRRAIVEQGINYDPQQKYLIDFEFFIRVAKVCRVGSLPEVLVKRHLRDESYFQRTFSRRHQQRRLVQLSMRAICQLRLPAWYYVFPIARLAYSGMPNALKRQVRRLGGLTEADYKTDE